MRRAWFVTVLALLSWAAAALEIPPVDGAKAGLERGRWAVEHWGNPGEVEYVLSAGRKLLKLTCRAGNSDKTAFRQETGFGAAEKSKLRLYVYAPRDFVPQVAVALLTGGEARWHESKRLDLKAGWNKLDVNLNDKRWKTDLSQWQHNVAVDQPGEIRGVALLVYNAERAGELYVQGLQYEPDEQGKRVNLLLKQLESREPAERAQAHARLLEFGRVAQTALQMAVEGDSAELAARAGKVLEEINRRAPELQQAQRPVEALPAQPTEENAEPKDAGGPRGTFLRPRNLALQAAHAETARMRELLAQEPFTAEHRAILMERLTALEQQLKRLDPGKPGSGASSNPERPGF